MFSIRRWLVLLLAAMLLVQVPMAMAEEDPFAVFDELFGPEQNVQGTLSAGAFEADYAYLVEQLLELVWPAAELYKEPAGPLTPSGDFISSALENGNTVNTSIALVPGDFLTRQAPDWADAAKNFKLKLSAASVLGMDFGALEWQQWGISVLTLKGLRDKDTFYAGSNVIGQDVLAITRQQIENLMYMGIQAGQKELARSSYGGQSTAWFLLTSLRQKDSQLRQAFDQFVSACNRELGGRVETAMKDLQPVNDPAYPSASFVATVDFSNEDIARILEKPDMWLAGALISTGWQRMISPDLPLEQNMALLESYARRGQASAAEAIREASFSGQVRCFLDSLHKPVAVEAKLDAGIMEFSFALTVENGEEGALYTVKIKLEGNNAYNPGTAYLDMALDHRNTGSGTFSARIYVVSGQERRVDLDAGIQYRFEWTGDKAGGTEKERLNVYFQETYSPIVRASLTSNATVSPSGIMRQVSLYYNDTYEPLASIALQTEATAGTALWDSMKKIPASQMLYPIQWDPEQWSSYAQSHAHTITGQLMQLVPLLPESIRHELGIYDWQ